MNMCFTNKFYFFLFVLVPCFVWECRGDDAGKPESPLGHDDVVWQYHYTTPAENMSPATGLVLRAISKSSGKALLRMSIGQDSNRPAMLFTMHCFDSSGRTFSSFYGTDSKGQDWLMCDIKEGGQVIAALKHWRNHNLDVSSSDELEKTNRRIQEMPLKPGEEALDSFPWKNLDGTILDQMGDYVEPAVEEIMTRDVDPSEESIEPRSVELEKIIGPDAICFYARVDFDNMVSVFSIPEAELDHIPSWKAGEKPPLSCEDAIAKVLEYLSALNGATNNVYEVRSVSLEQLSRLYKKKWYYMAEVQVKKKEEKSDFLDICVLMNGTIVEPKKVSVKLIENVSSEEIGRVEIK